MFRVVAVVVLLLLLAALAPTATTSRQLLLRLPLENFDQMQFFGRVGVGTPPQQFDVIFDTGSSDVWLPAASCAACAGKRRYEPTASSSHEELPEAFALAYGSGNASGATMRETLALGRLSLAGVRMGRANATSPPLQRFRADGIVGLGLEALSLVTKPSLFTAAAAVTTMATSQDDEEDGDVDLRALLERFSVYVNPLPGHEPPSQLIFGGADDALVLRGDQEEEEVQWHRFPVVPFPDQHALGFWSLRLHELAVLGGSTAAESSGIWEADALQRSDTNARQRSAEDADDGGIIVSRHAVAIVDSGTSVLLFPPRVFKHTIERIQRHLARRHGGLQLRASESSVSGYACTRCAPEMFPSLAFAFWTGKSAKTLLLQGLDYVRCDGDVCMPQIDAHTLFQTGSEQGAGQREPKATDDVIVLGAIFLRAYYALFDVQARHVGFACGDRGACLGGRNPKLQFHAGFVAADGRLSVSLLFWARFYFAAGVLVLMIAGALLWTTASAAKSEDKDKDKSSSSSGRGDADASDPIRDQPQSETRLFCGGKDRLGKSPSQLELESAVLLQLGRSSSCGDGEQTTHAGCVSWRKSVSFEV